MVNRLIAGASLVIFAASGCASAGSEAETASAPQSGRGSLSVVLDSAEFADTPYADMYLVIRAHRPTWLNDARTMWRRHANPRTHQETARAWHPRTAWLMVFLDDARLGHIDSLREVHPGIVATAQYFPPAEAMVRYGQEYDGGVIQLQTRRTAGR